jgi:hypothetical protein
VKQAAWLLGAMAGSDPADPATAEAYRHKVDYARALDAIPCPPAKNCQTASGPFPAIRAIGCKALKCSRSMRLGAGLESSRGFRNRKSEVFREEALDFLR